MNELCLKIWLWSKSVNWFRVVFIIITAYFGIAGYVGKKALYHNITKKRTKKELAEQSGPGRKSTSKKVQKESDWKTYFGSAKPIMEMIKAGKEDEFTREILTLTPNKKLLTYYESKILFTLGVLENPDYYFNDNILGKFYTKDFTS